MLIIPELRAAELVAAEATKRKLMRLDQTALETVVAIMDVPEKIASHENHHKLR